MARPPNPFKGAGQRVEQVFKVGPVRVKAGLRSIDKGAKRIGNALHSLAADRSYVKAGLMGKARKTRPTPKVTFRDPRQAERAVAMTSGALSGINPVLLALLAQSGQRAKDRAKANPLNNVQLGIIHEFGTKTMPARPFIRPAFKRNKADYLKILRALVKASVYTGNMPFPRALAIIGARMAADMKKYVTAGPQIQPPNSPRWAAIKAMRGQWKWDARAAASRAKNKPVKEGPIPPPRTLVDTGRMVGSITWAVVQESTGDHRRARARARASKSKGKSK